MAKIPIYTVLLLKTKAGAIGREMKPRNNGLERKLCAEEIK
jgi:hypothetical protein